MADENTQSVKQAVQEQLGTQRSGTVDEAVGRLTRMRGDQSSEQTDNQDTTDNTDRPGDEQTLPGDDETDDTPPDSEVKSEQDADNKAESNDANEIELDAEQLSAVLGLDSNAVSVDEDGALTFKTNVDGEQGNATLAQLIESYQKDASLTNRGKEIAKVKKDRETALNDFVQSTQQHAQEFATILETLKQIFVQPIDPKLAADLRENDPGQLNQMRLDAKEREDAFNMLLKAAHDEVTKAQKTQKDEFDKQMKTYMDEQGAELATLIPNAEKVLPEVVKYLSKDFSETEIQQLGNARIWNLAYKAMQLDKGLEGAKTKLVKKVPKLVKTGKSTKVAPNLGEHQKARTSLKQSGSITDAVAALKTRG